MILVGNQRGGAKDLAQHLLKEENDHVQVHELRGFASDNLHSALNESYAISRATKCRQFLYSLSINPPPDKEVSTEDFEAAINRAEGVLGLTGQPRAIVFHEKEGPGGTRRHAHAVWSRIDADEMKAIQLSHTKLKLTGLSRELFMEHQFKMPRGLMASEERDPRNFSFEEWQQAKRANRNLHDIRTEIQDCWAVSDSRPAFVNALQSRGYKLARGDRRSYVAVDTKGEPYAIAKYAGVKTKDVRARLHVEGEKVEGERLPSVDECRASFAAEIAQRLKQLRTEEEQRQEEERTRIEAKRKATVERQRAERATQDAALKVRWERETAERQARFNTGLFRGLIDRLSGALARTRDQNMREAYAAVLRDRTERDALVFQQLRERRAFDLEQRQAQCLAQERKQELDADIQQREPAREETRTAVPVPARAENSGPSPPVRAPVPNPTPTVATASPAPDNTREARREAFMQQRQEPPATPTRDHASRVPVPAINPEPVTAPSTVPDDNREARREAFMRQRQEQAAPQTRDHGPRRDLDR